MKTGSNGGECMEPPGYSGSLVVVGGRGRNLERLIEKADLREDLEILV